MTKEPKLEAAVRIVPEWQDYDQEIKQLQHRFQEEKEMGALYGDKSAKEASREGMYRALALGRYFLACLVSVAETESCQNKKNQLFSLPSWHLIVYIFHFAYSVGLLDAGTSRQYEQVSIAAAQKPEIKELKVKNGVERTEMLFRQVSNFIE